MAHIFKKNHETCVPIWRSWFQASAQRNRRSLSVKQMEGYSFKAYWLWESLCCVPDNLLAAAPTIRGHQSTGHLRVTAWVGQKVAPMHRMEMQLAQNKVSWNAVGLKIGAKTKNFHSKIQLRSFSFGETLLERQVFYTFSRFMLYFLSEHLSKLLYWMDPDTNSKLLSCKV